MIRLRNFFLTACILISTTGLTALAAPSVEVAPPPVNVTGWLESTDASFVQLQTRNQFYVSTTGDKLGDYELRSIKAGKATFGYHAHQWVMGVHYPNDTFMGITKNVEEPAPTEAAKAFPEPNVMAMNFSNADLVYSLKMVARASHVDIAIAPGVDGAVNLRGIFNSGSAVQSLLEGRHTEWLIRNGILIVAPQGTLSERLALADANSQQLGALNEAKPVSLDFVNADLAYVCEVCSKHVQANNVAPLPEGSVTCTLHAKPSATALGLMLALQESPVTVTVHAPNISYAQPPLAKPGH